MTGRFARLALQLISVVALSRVISPADFGLVAMVVAVIGIGELLREFGLGSAAIQARVLTRQQRDNLFWASTSLGALMTVLVVIAAPALSALYGESRVALIAAVLSTTFFFTGMTSQHRASLARDLRFAALQTSDLVPAIVGVGTAFALGLLGFGYWALVAQQVVQAVLGMVLAVCLAGWLPGLPRRTDGMSALFHYGVNLVLAQVLGYATKNVHAVVIGARFGPAPLGIYNRAYELVVHPINQLNMPSTKVAVPILSRLQSDWDRYCAFLFRGQRIMLHLVLPVLALGAALASPLVALALGPQWAGSAPVLQILVFAVAGDSFGYALYWYALSRDETRIELRVNLVSAPLRIAAVVIGAQWGILGVAMGFAVGQWLHTSISFTWYGLAAGAPSWGLLRSGGSVVLLNVAPAIAAATTAVLMVGAPALAQVAAGTGVFALAWGLSVLIVPMWRREVRAIATTVKHLRRR